MKDYENLKKHAKDVEVVPNSYFSKNHLASWRNPGDDFEIVKLLKEKENFKYELSYRDEKGKKYFTNGHIKAENSEEARLLAEYYPRVLGMKKIWCCVFIKDPMQIFDGNGM